MTCEQCEIQLNALADGALPRVQAWGVRRHLAQCRDCAPLFAEIVQMGADARAWRNTAPPAALQNRIALVLPPQTARMENTAMILEHPQPVAVPPRRFVTRKARIALALAACLAVVLAVTLWPSKQAPLPAAYADTVLAMQRVRNVAWTQTITVYNPDGSIRTHQIIQTWVRRNPPAIAYSVLPEAPGYVTRGRYWTLQDVRGSHFTKPNGDRVQIRPFGRPIADQVRDTLDDLALSRPQKNTLFFGGSQSAAANEALWKQEQVRLNGQVLLRFRKSTTAAYSGPMVQPTKDPVTHFLTLWVDLQTHRLQRREWQAASYIWGSFDDVQDHFVYDQTAPAGVFDGAAYSGVRLHAPVTTPKSQSQSHPPTTHIP